MSRYELTGKVALVTGGAQGIGLATARALLARGAFVAIVDLDQAAPERVAAQLHDMRALGVAADVTDRSAIERAIGETVDRFGGLDVVVANAGIVSAVATVRATPSESFERVLDVNLLGACRTVDAALSELIRREGHVVLVSSVYAFVNGAGTVPYAMSKAALEQLGRALRVELHQHGASASVAYFGFVDTKLVHRALDSDPLARALLTSLPTPMHKRLAPAVAGEAIVHGIEHRRPRIIRPRRWMPISILRGILGPLTDAYVERNPTVQDELRRLEARQA
jgi:NAD(P)-dependent dehydrogenase (short-subunit alcohol dehydrogenase family)